MAAACVAVLLSVSQTGCHGPVDAGPPATGAGGALPVLASSEVQSAIGTDSRRDTTPVEERAGDSSSVAVIDPQQAAREASAEDWPCFLGPRHDGTSAEPDVNTHWPKDGPQEIWRRKIGTGYSSPAVTGGRLVIMHRQGDEEFVECFAAATGDSLWRRGYATDYECPYQYSNGPYSTPAIDDGRVFAWSAEGTLRCLDMSTGEPIWQRDLNAEYEAELGMFPIASSPLIEDDLLILNVGGREKNAGVVALNKDTGETVWTATSDGPGDSTALAATIHGERYVFMLTEDGLASLDPANGAVHWQIPFRAKAPDTSNATTPVINGDLVMISAYKVGSLCIRVLPEGGYEEVWRDRRALMCQYHNLISRDDCVYGFSSNDHSFRCIDWKTGKLKWKWQPEMGRGQTIALDDGLITIFENGQLGALEVSPSGWEVRSLTASPIVQAKCFSSPALSRGRLFLRSDTDLVRLDMDAGE